MFPLQYSYFYYLIKDMIKKKKSSARWVYSLARAWSHDLISWSQLKQILNDFDLCLNLKK